MKNYFILLLLSVVITTTYGQNDSISMVIGIEASSNFHHINNRIGLKGMNSSYGLSLEFPKNKFSYGVAALKKNYGLRRSSSFTGKTSESIDVNTGEVTTRYAFYRSDFTFDYLALSNRLSYRLPCNCAYIFASYDLEFLNDFNEIIFDQERPSHATEMPPVIIQKESLKKINQSFAVGIGVKAHFAERFRLNMRVTYGLTKRPSIELNESYKGDYTYLAFNLGFQYGLGKF